MIPKPAKGTERKRLAAKRKRVRDVEVSAKNLVRFRDPHCRWPHRTVEERVACARAHNEVAHIDGKGMGGNKDGSRNVVENLITVCAPTHQGPGSMHAGMKRIWPLNAVLGSRGPCSYQEKVDGAWIEIGRDDINGRW